MNTTERTLQNLLSELACAGMDIEVVSQMTSQDHNDIIFHYGDNNSITLQENISDDKVITFLLGMTACFDCEILNNINE